MLNRPRDSIINVFNNQSTVPGEVSNSNLNAMTWIAILVSLAVGLVVFYVYNDLLLAASLFLLLMGLYEVCSSIVRNGVNNQYGTNESDAALMWGFVLLTLGCMGITYYLTKEWIFTILSGIAIAVVYLVIRIAKNRQ